MPLHTHSRTQAHARQWIPKIHLSLLQIDATLNESITRNSSSPLTSACSFHPDNHPTPPSTAHPDIPSWLTCFFSIQAHNFAPNSCIVSMAATWPLGHRLDAGAPCAVHIFAPNSFIVSMAATWSLSGHRLDAASSFRWRPPCATSFIVSMQCIDNPQCQPYLSSTHAHLMWRHLFAICIHQYPHTVTRTRCSALCTIDIFCSSHTCVQSRCHR